MDFSFLRGKSPWLLLAVVPVASYFMYRNLTPAQKKKFKKSVTEGSFSLASAVLYELIDRYRQANGHLPLVQAGNRFQRMAAIPNSNETETTVGAERWN